ncbi:response regulator [Natronorubrum sp. DTA28]|uniref:response regulator n=1 Tax=Natronorubrum sp. DTA28 TaxID=3447019 RepID=UPI003F871025
MVVPTGHPIRVLCVDDDAALLGLTAVILEKTTDSLVVDTEEEPETALERIHDQRYDCIVTDYEMPTMNGIELLEAVREFDENLPVILFTGSGSEAVASEAISAGVTNYLRKGAGTNQYELLANQITNAVSAYRNHQELECKTAAMEEAPVGITITDPSATDNPIIYANRTFTELTGYTQSDIIGHNCRFLQGERTRQEPVDEMRAAIDAREPVSVDIRNYRRDGTMFWNGVTIAPIGGDGESDLHFVGFQTDITRRKLAEERLNRQRERLEEFASTVSHDLRGPLTAASGYLKLAREQIDDDVPYLDEVEAAHERMETLIDDMLSLARAGTVATETAPVSLAAAADAAWNTSPHVESTLEIEVDGRTTLFADESRLVQLLENLFGNSHVHGTTEGHDGEKPTVTVTVGTLEDGFFVEDDGPGVPAADRDVIFESGYTTGEGTGLGLRIVRDIVDAHGWDVSIVEGSTGGARFEITGVESG